MISQSARLANDPEWLEYAKWAELHFIKPTMTKESVRAMKAGLALGYDAGVFLRGQKVTE